MSFCVSKMRVNVCENAVMCERERDREPVSKILRCSVLARAVILFVSSAKACIRAQCLAWCHGSVQKC